MKGKHQGGLHRQYQIDPGPEQRQKNLSFVFWLSHVSRPSLEQANIPVPQEKETARRKHAAAGHSPVGRQAGRQNTRHDNAYRRRENPEDAVTCQTRNTGHGAKQPPRSPAYALLTALCLPFPQFVTLPARNSSCSS